MAFKFGPPNIIINGLIFYVDAANPRSYTNGSTTWYDLSLTNNNSTITAAPTFNSANAGSLLFNGTSQYATSTSALGSDSDLYFTFSSWFKPVNLNVAAYVFSRGRDQPSVGWSLELGILGDNKYTVGATQVVLGLDTSYTATGSSAITSPNWVNLTGVYDRDNVSTGLKLYVNGVLESSSSITNNNLRTSTVGASICRIQNGQYANAYVASTLVYNRVLSAAEILQNYNAVKGRFNL